MEKEILEVRQIDAWADEQGSWIWNDSIGIGFLYVSEDETEESVFRKWLCDNCLDGFTDNERYIMEYVEDDLTIMEADTRRPVLCACYSEFYN